MAGSRNLTFELGFELNANFLLWAANSHRMAVQHLNSFSFRQPMDDKEDGTIQYEAFPSLTPLLHHFNRNSNQTWTNLKQNIVQSFGIRL